MDRENTVDEIKARLDISDIIAEHVDLKRAGQNFKGLCPFHAEKTPSFTVNPSRQIFHCFGCGKGGDILAFIMEYENMSFQEAVSYLAEKAGIRIEERRNEPKENRGLKENLHVMYREAMELFRSNLPASRRASAYVAERGLTGELIEKFSLGYSSTEKDALFSRLKKLNFPQDHIKASGLVYFGERDTYDFFRDRLMFPIFDGQGRVIAFGGRIMTPSKSAPKYINSPDSIIFKKGDSCYGLHTAKGSIAKKGYSLISEGYMDVIRCHQYGFDNAVAPLGTALTPGHLKKLKRFAGKILLVFDGDAAGVAATRRSLEIVYAAGMTPKILLLPQGEDPDSFLKKHGAEEFRRAMSKAVSPVDFLIGAAGKNRMDAVKGMLNLLASCPDQLMQDETLRELSEKSKANELTLRDELKRIRQGAARTGPRRGDSASATDASASRGEHISKEEQLLLRIVLSVPERASSLLKSIGGVTMESDFIRGIFEKIRAVTAAGKAEEFRLDELLKTCVGDEKGFIAKLTIAPEFDVDNADEALEDCLRVMALKDIEKRIQSAHETGDDVRALLLRKKDMTKKAPA